MKFCASCNTPLNLFDVNDDDLCTSCLKKTFARQAPPQPETAPPVTTSDIPGVVLTCKDDKLMLHSKEGWLLWSGPATGEHSLETILNRARRILAIRQKSNSA